jgi:hypothetical protein
VDPDPYEIITDPKPLLSGQLDERCPVLPELVNALRLKGAEDLWLLATELEAGIVAEPEAAALLVAPVLEVVAAEGAARLQVQAQHLGERPLVQVHLAQAQAQPFLKNT